MCDNIENTDDEKTQFINNKHLKTLNSDCLYHLGFNTTTNDLHKDFGDVKFICMGGTTHRMKMFAEHIAKVLNLSLPIGQVYADITGSKQRYSMFKVGPVIAVTHGMGSPSLSILLHELFKLLHYAKCKDVTILRLGTSGGIGVSAGSLVITNKAFDGLLREKYEQHILGKSVLDDATVNQDLVKEIKLTADKELRNINTYVGATMCCNDFYEGQCRLDGAFCQYDNSDKDRFIKRLQEKGIVNIDMESTTLFAMCAKANIKCAIINVTLINRLVTDQVNVDPVTYEDYQRRPQLLAGLFIKNRLSRNAHD